MNKDQVMYAVKNVGNRRVRSGLTILSILIGIAAIFALVSFGQGLSNYVVTFSEKMGTDKLILQTKSALSAPGTESTFYISKEDIDYVRKINGVSEITGIYTSAAQVESRNQKKYTFAMGLEPSGPEEKLLEETFNIEIGQGRQLKEGDVNKVVLGYNYMVANKVFKVPLKLNDKITVNGKKVEVVGFYKEIGNPADDAQVYFTKETYEAIFDNKDKYQIALIRAAPDQNPEKLADTITEKLRKHKGIEKGQEDFYVQTFQQAIETFTTVLNIINIILVLIALISVLVAGVNIANTMYTSVLERTKEIGVMKAIGAKNSDIAEMFVIESGMLGLIGGALGVIFGLIISMIGGFAAKAAGYSMIYPKFSIWLVFGCLLFAFIIGAASGLFPAMQAAKLKPVDALREE